MEWTWTEGVREVLSALGGPAAAGWLVGHADHAHVVAAVATEKLESVAAWPAEFSSLRATFPAGRSREVQERIGAGKNKVG